MKIWIWVRDRILAFWLFWLWFFGIENTRSADLHAILELRRENLELKDENKKLKQILENLTDSGFSDDPAEFDLERLKSQFGMFFIRSGLDALPYEEFYFLRKTFLDGLSCAFLLGAKKNGDRVAKSKS